MDSGRRHAAGPAAVSSSASVDLSGMRSMFIRARANEGDRGKPGATRLEGLALETGGVSHVLGDLVPSGKTAEYLRISDAEFGLAWRLTGVAVFEWPGTFPDKSRLNHTVKLTTVEVASGFGEGGGVPDAAVPLPAAGWLTLAGLGALAGLGRRRARQG
jgi:hypothetical protein